MYLSPAGQDAPPDGLALVVSDLQSRVSFYQWTTAIAAASAAGLYAYHRYGMTEKITRAKASTLRHGRAARDAVRSAGKSIRDRAAGRPIVSPLPLADWHVYG
jgi:hypothetical protein